MSDVHNCGTEIRETTFFLVSIIGEMLQIAIGNSQLVIHGLLEQFSIGRRKPNTKVITTANNNEVLHRY